jgi:predicted  nucleic acid-binding Zn-ribbon protein
MLFQKLMRGDALDQCPSCARILYYEPPADVRQGD